MSLVSAFYAGFALLSLPLFRLLPARQAIAVVYLAGLLYLPPLAYPPVDPRVFPWWITGSALPSDLMLGRAWVVPLVALVGGLAVDRAAWRAFRPCLGDLAMLGWCLWPMAQTLVVPGTSSPAGWRSALYMMGVWGVPWLLGRVHFSTRDDGWLLLKIFCLVTLPLAPFALWEGLAGPGLHDAMFGHHPFRADGVERYLGYRPLLLFEHGNQYGIWICCAALAAAAVARAAHEAEVRRETHDRAVAGRWLVIAAVLGLMALIAQSAGALLLLLVALAPLFSRAVRRWVRLGLAPLLFCGALLGGVYASGALPIRAIVENTASGQALLEGVRATGRGSIAWRVSQDLKTLPLIAQNPVAGLARWDWWRPAETRPWSEAMLILGQFGVIGLLLAAMLLCGPVIDVLAMPRRGRRRRQLQRAMALIVAMAVVDGMLNSFIFLPAILLAGALAARPVSTRGRPSAERHVVVEG